MAQVGLEYKGVVPYFSHAFSKIEKRYCVKRCELLAVVLAA